MGILESLIKATINVAAVPVTVAADIITLGGSLNDRGESYTTTELRDLMKNLEDAGKPEK